MGGALGRMIRVQRHITTTGHRHRVHADDEVDGATHPQRYQGLRTDAPLDQIAGEPIDPRRELTVGQRFARDRDGLIRCPAGGSPVEGDRGRLRGARGLFGEQVRERLGGQRVVRLIPASEYPRAFGLVE
ncbi:hypothetical protein FMUAM8_50520 [Nocardia cyriacigeorgica]|nr:hypothetical protein FMUAM8_50520 [Nocardia cyriacigeorgica]